MKYFVAFFLNVVIIDTRTVLLFSIIYIMLLMKVIIYFLSHILEN